MGKFPPHLTDLQTAILSTGWDPQANSTCACSRGTALYRCRDCFQGPVQCQTCIVQSHLHHPFHHIEEWTGKHFNSSSLGMLGFKLHLGHGGTPCPNRSPSSDGRNVVVVHTNGMHNHTVMFCCCSFPLREVDQLVKAKLFPGTVELSATVFTFAVLDNMHIHGLASKKSIYDYHDALQKLTNAAFPQTVPKRYREFLRVARIWRYLATLRRSGQFFGIDDHLANRRPGSLALRCPACPEIGFNVDEDTMLSHRTCLSHKYTLFVSADGNFRLQRANKRDDPDDLALNGGNAYFVEDSGYKEYLKTVDPSSNQSTCAHLDAVKTQELRKFKHVAVSGVVSIQCSRHGFYLPQGTADLEKGEAYARTDYALMNALKDALQQRWILGSYDIWCQYYINLPERVQKRFPEMLSILPRIRGAIPKMHIKGHIQSCQSRWSFNYLPHSGETCGEGIETGWAEQNQSAGSTKQQNAGHRHDSIDDDLGYWNWTKSHTIVGFLARQYIKCCNRLKTLEREFTKLTERHKKHIISKWKAMDTTPKLINGTWVSVYDAQFLNGMLSLFPTNPLAKVDCSGGPPTQSRAYEQLLKAEEGDKTKGKPKKGDAKFIQDGLDLEQQQYAIQALIQNDSPKTTITKARIALHKKMKPWLALQAKGFPELRTHLPNPDTTRPEDIPLLLPSAFDASSRAKLELVRLATVEMSLREGQCYDALDDLRRAIHIFNSNLQFKKSNIRGQRPNTRAQAFLQSLSTHKTNAAVRYRHSREAMLQLGLSPTDKSLQPLKNDQLWGKVRDGPAKLGDSKLQEPWFWSAGRPRGLTKRQITQWELERECFFF
ncbi:hypothetical protein BDN72DRAFT_777913 [Pluteus cervinus]|uniref:Uncharacterized protein n=1 Tax=Pluteus cervinus TaxID=181527 RepID=A0ACD3A7P4_9AGAR|nr:hypothetical protein BDN72DRAFT_777913 [Pluteus cervinus]